MSEITIHYVGKVQPQGRPRHRVIKTKDGRVFSHTYEDAKSRDFKSVLHLLAQEQMGQQELFEGALSLELCVSKPIPKSMTKRDRKLVEEGRLLPTTKPDVDNILKAVMDAMNKVVYKDDSQIAVVSVSKQYAEKEGVDIRITNIEMFKANCLLVRR